MDADPIGFAKAIAEMFWEGECGEIDGGTAQELLEKFGIIHFRKPTAEELSGPEWWGHEYDIGPDTVGVGEFTPSFKDMRKAQRERNASATADSPKGASTP
jgi:hypothetical protein